MHYAHPRARTAPTSTGRVGRPLCAAHFHKERVRNLEHWGEPAHARAGSRGRREQRPQRHPDGVPHQLPRLGPVRCLEDLPPTAAEPSRPAPPAPPRAGYREKQQLRED
jgi:hypothetical protein